MAKANIEGNGYDTLPAVGEEVIEAILGVFGIRCSEHANALAAAIPHAKEGARLQMKLVYNSLGPLLLFLLQWINISCTISLPGYLNIAQVVVHKVFDEGMRKISKSGRKSTIIEFYAVILPSLEQLHLAETGDNNDESLIRTSIDRKEVELNGENINVDSERDKECGICLVPCTKIVFPECCHAMCIKCYDGWSIKSDSCLFCRGNLERVDPSDLWVLISEDDHVVDFETAIFEDLKRFYQYIKNLPKESPDELL